MILYHATRASLGKRILDDGIIRCNVPREYMDPVFVSSKGRSVCLASTNGYVYLASNPFTAISFGNAHAHDRNENKLYLFEVQVDAALLQPDFDQLRIEEVRRNCTYPQDITVQGCIRECYCAALPQDINLAA